MFSFHFELFLGFESGGRTFDTVWLNKLGELLFKVAARYFYRSGARCCQVISVPKIGYLAYIEMEINMYKQSVTKLERFDKILLHFCVFFTMGNLFANF